LRQQTLQVSLGDLHGLPECVIEAIHFGGWRIGHNYTPTLLVESSACAFRIGDTEALAVSGKRRLEREGTVNKAGDSLPVLPYFNHPVTDCSVAGFLLPLGATNPHYYCRSHQWCYWNNCIPKRSQRQQSGQLHKQRGYIRQQAGSPGSCPKGAEAPRWVSLLY
jgi:hypothetical protein